MQGKARALLADAMTVAEARIGPPPAPGAPAGGLYFPPSASARRRRSSSSRSPAMRYPSTDAGIYARYQEAATSLALGNSMQAAGVFQQVIDKAGDGFYGQMARLGLAEAQARAGQYDQAITAFKEMSQRKDGPLPVDGILMQLAKTYLEAGKRADAQQTFTKLVDEYSGVAVHERRQGARDLKKTSGLEIGIRIRFQSADPSDPDP